MFRAAAQPSILHVIDVAGSGGAETVFCQLVRHFEDRSENAVIVLPSQGWVASQLSSLQTRIVYLPSKGSLSFRFLWKLGVTAKIFRANVLVAHLLGSAVYAAIMGLFLRRPVIAIFHGALDFSDPGRFARLKCWLLSRRHVRIVAVSAGVRDALVAWGVCPDRLHVIRNGIDTREFMRAEGGSLRAELGIAPSDRLVGAVGNLHPVKGYELMIHAAAAVVRTSPGVTFVVAGEGDPSYRERLEDLIEQLGLRDRFRLIGFRAATADFYSELDVFLSTASSEGLPLSFLEAMSCGVPIVATSNEGSVGLLQASECGLLVEPPDAQGVANAVLEVLENGSLAARLGRSGRRAALENFSLQGTFDQYVQLVLSAISTPPRF
jgi:glycosyltransferase involved in cell wall biosynthesis